MKISFGGMENCIFIFY